MDGPFRALRETDFDVEDLGLTSEEIRSGLEKAVKRGSLLRVEADVLTYFLLNSPRGRAALHAIKSGEWNPKVGSAALPIEHPNVFRLYEENIGPLTPMIADMLREAEKEYPNAWFEEALEIAVARNVRNWKYVEAILKRWKEKGKDERKDQQGADKDFKRYTEGEFAEYFKHD